MTSQGKEYLRKMEWVTTLWLVLQLLLLLVYSRLLMKVSSNKRLVFMLFREFLEISKGSLFVIL